MTWLLSLAILSGIFGRMGGAGKSGSWYDGILDKNWRDIGCSVLVVLAVGIILGWYSSFWWVYLLVFALHWITFSTYWDGVFGYDNFWFSGGMVGLSLAPILFMDISLWWLVAIRMLVVGIAWGLLNKFRRRIWVWKEDVVEEFCRYAVSL